MNAPRVTALRWLVARYCAIIFSFDAEHVLPALISRGHGSSAGSATRTCNSLSWWYYFLYYFFEIIHRFLFNFIQFSSISFFFFFFIKAYSCIRMLQSLNVFYTEYLCISLFVSTVIIISFKCHYCCCDDWWAGLNRIGSDLIEAEDQ